MSNQSTAAGMEIRRQNFERILSGKPFIGLKAVLDSLTSDRAALCDGIGLTNSYEELLARLGYRITLTRQVHVQDAYTRLGRTGGIKTVLPYHDIPTQRSLPTLVHFDSSVTTTAASAGFFNQLLAELKIQLSAQE